MSFNVVKSASFLAPVSRPVAKSAVKTVVRTIAKTVSASSYSGSTALQVRPDHAREPLMIQTSLDQVVKNTVAKEFGWEIASVTDQFRFQTKESFSNSKELDSIRENLKTLSDEELEKLVQANRFMESCELKGSRYNNFSSKTPLLSKMRDYLKDHTVRQALDRIPRDVHHVSTPHPENPDRAARRRSEVNLRRTLKKSERLLEEYDNTVSPGLKKDSRQKLDRNFAKGQGYMNELIKTDPKRVMKQTPENEQRSINDRMLVFLDDLIENEEFLSRIMRESLFEGLAEELIHSAEEDHPRFIVSQAEKEELERVVVLDRSVRSNEFKTNPTLMRHPYYKEIMDFRFNFKQGKWAMDTCGNPFVNQKTLLVSCADGIEKLFTHFDMKKDVLNSVFKKEDDPELHEEMLTFLKDYQPQFSKLMKKWDQEGRSYLYQLSALVKHLKMETVESARDILEAEHPDVSKLTNTRGFKNNDEALRAFSLLARIEKKLGLPNHWQRQFTAVDRVSMHLGYPYARFSQKAVEQATTDILTDAGLGQISDRSEALNKAVSYELPFSTPRSFSPETRELIGNLNVHSQLTPDGKSQVLQSDSYADIELSHRQLNFLLNKAKNKSWRVILLEDKDAMLKFLATLDKDPTIIKGMHKYLAMFAGSDNLKLLMPILGGALNARALGDCYLYDIWGKFGQGSSFIRSLLTPTFGIITTQPGQDIQKGLDPRSHYTTSILNGIDTATKVHQPQAYRDKNFKIVSTIGEKACDKVWKHLIGNEKLMALYESYIKESINHSRPGKKSIGASIKPEDFFAMLRAIGGARGDMSMANFDRLVFGLKEAVQEGINGLKAEGFTQGDIHEAFMSDLSEYNFIVPTLKEMYNAMDDDLSTGLTAESDLREAISLLTGEVFEEMPMKDPNLRFKRLLVEEITRRNSMPKCPTKFELVETVMASVPV